MKRQQSMKMISVALNYDVLAMCCIEKYVIIGIGNQIHVYNNSTLNRELVINTFHHDPIHGIIKSGKQLIIFGGRCLSIFQFQTMNNTIRFENSSKHSFNDWTITAEFFPGKSHENICILFAHNNLYFYNILTKKYTNIWCEEKCLLYSGYISTEELKQVVILSGTVFQEILIWKITQDSLFTASDRPVLWRLKGHKGVIFSIFYDSCKKLITTTSDDRTVRLWQIKNSCDELPVCNNWDDIEINLKSTMYGHSSRVWKSIIVDNNIISIGEDSQFCIWSLEGNLRDKFTAHNGATVWSIEVSDDKSCIFTGGANGGVNSWPSVSNQIETTLMPTLEFQGKKSPKYVLYLQSGTILIFIDNGELFSYHSNKTLLKHSVDLSKYENYCLMQVCPNRTKVVFASNDGHVDIFEEVNNKLEVNKISKKVLESKIFSIHWLNDDALLICGNQGHLKVLIITKTNELQTQSEFILPMSRERWTTTAILLENLLICGDRCGNIHVYKTNTQKNHKNPIQTLTKVHQVLGVQYLQFIDKKLISTGRDGALRYYKINFEDDSSSILKSLYCKNMPMVWVSKIVKIKQDIYVMGFKEIEFMIYSINLQHLIVKFICGGGHRSWDCIFSNGFIQFTCIRNKKVYTVGNVPCTDSKTIISGYHTKEIHCIQVLPSKSNKNILLSASEDCTLRITDLQELSPKHYQFSCIDSFDGHISNVKCLDILNLNNSKDKTKNLIFSGGGRAQLKVWQVIIDTTREKLSSDDLEVTELTSYMLRGTDKDRRKTWLNKKQEYFIDPETRFMDINVYSYYLDNNIIILFVACSDGFIRIFIYNIDINNLHLTTMIPYYNRCIIKIHTFLYQDQVILISMATDGIINLWSMNNTIKNILDANNSDNHDNNNINMEKSRLRPFKYWNAHQSGINSYDFKQKNKEFLLLSGGDDNKVSLCLFTLSINKNSNLAADIIAVWSSSSTHNTQVTGIKFYGENKFISVAIDQRIVTYYYTYRSSKLLVRPLHKISLTSVADVHGLTLLNNNSYSNTSNDTLACIYGRGVEIILFNNEN